ncbi:MAG: hypothetical protein WBO17_05340 [Sphingorhabdus sp.]
MQTRTQQSGIQWAIPLAFTPFMFAIVATILLVLIVGNEVPRAVAYGSSLAIWGLGAAFLSAVLPLQFMQRKWPQPNMRRAGLIACGLAALMAWPVWTMGILPTVNGLVMGAITTSEMRLMRQETSHASKSRQIYHWAYLQPVSDETPLRAGRYFVTAQDYARWNSKRPDSIQVDHANGLLGAEVVLGFR